MAAVVVDLATTAAISTIIFKLGNMAASYFGGDITRKELRHLQTIILPKILTLIDAVDRIHTATISKTQRITRRLRPLLIELQAAAYEAEDILDLYECNKIKQEYGDGRRNDEIMHHFTDLQDYHHLRRYSRRVSTRNDRAEASTLKIFEDKRKENIRPAAGVLRRSFGNLQALANEAYELISLLPLDYPTPQYDNTTIISQRRTTFPFLWDPVMGREEERNDLVDMLTTMPHESSSNRRNIIVLQGIGGAGKTKLAQYVYMDERVGVHFDLKIWIHVSCIFDIPRITGDIIQAVEHTDSLPVGNLDALQRRLKEDLKSRRFLLFLDDIWIGDKDRHLWDQLLIPLTEIGEAGSKILVTTRMAVQNLGVQRVNIVHLKELKTEECWSILKYSAFGDVDKEIQDSQLADVGKDILCKLWNSPLAATLVGRLLREKVSIDEWRRILDTDMLGETLNYILLSFQHLPPHLQRCFAICSLYPKGYKHRDEHINQLVRLWVAHGYVEAIGNEPLMDKGRQYLDDLVFHSVFQSHPASNGVYVMHDLMHAVAEKVSKDTCFRIEGDDPVSIPANVVHLSIVRGKLDLHMPNILKLANLRTFIIIPSYEVEFNNSIEHTSKMFKKLPNLRVLRFGLCQVPELINFVGELKHLRCLQLIGAEEISESLATIYHL